MNELQRIEPMPVAPPLTANDILAQVRLIQEVMGAVMKDKEHYGTIPGCGDKPTLLQPGAQKLLMTFRLAPEYEIFENQLTGGHREYRVTTTLLTIGSGQQVGQGVGCCSTMEGKFRFRVAPKKLTDRPVPKAYWDLKAKDPKAAQKELGGPGFSVRKNDDGQWMITEGTSEKVEHDNPADYYNTVLKMAKKRALVDATITATAASDIFTQDLEDMPEVIEHAGKAITPAQVKPEPSEPPPAAAKPAERPPATKAEVLPPTATAATLAWMINELAAYDPKLLLDFAQKADILMPLETLEDWPLDKVPTTKEDLRKLMHSVERFRDGDLAPEAGEAEAWRTFPLPFGKQAGTLLGDADKKYLYGLWANYTVEKEYNGKSKSPAQIAKDQLFRDMLDDAGQHYEFTKRD